MPISIWVEERNSSISHTSRVQIQWDLELESYFNKEEKQMQNMFCTFNCRNSPYLNDDVNALARKDGRTKTQWENSSITDIIASLKWNVLCFHHYMSLALKLTHCHWAKCRTIFCLPTEDKNISVINNRRYAFMRNAELKCPGLLPLLSNM